MPLEDIDISINTSVLRLWQTPTSLPTGSASKISYIESLGNHGRLAFVKLSRHGQRSERTRITPNLKMPFYAHSL